MNDLERVLSGRYRLEFDERFDGDSLDPDRWIPHHLPQWSSRAQSAAHYELGADGLTLRIDADQQPWCPEFDGTTRVSAIQTGVGSGPVGGTIGQHRFNDEAVVREEQPTQHLITPRYGVIRVSAAADIDENGMVALWMFGVEESPEQSGVLDVMEIFGRDCTESTTAVGMNVKALADPALTDDVGTVELPINVADRHDYAAEWTPDHVRFYVDGDHVRTIDQSPSYPLVCLLGIYDFDQRPAASASGYPKRLVIDRFRIYEARAAD